MNGTAGLSAGFAALGLLSFAISSVGLAARDLRTGILPNRAISAALLVTGTLLVASVVAFGAETGSWIEHDSTVAAEIPTNWPPPVPAFRWLAETLGGAAACFAGAFALWLAAPGSLGGGDVKAAPLVGLVLGFTIGWPGILWGILLAATIASLWALIRRAFAPIRRNRHRPQRPETAAPNVPIQHSVPRSGAATLPFAPALFGGAWIVLVVDAVSVVAQSRS